MGLMSPNRRGPRRFDYEPRYYNPHKDESIKRRMRIQGRTRRKSNTGLRLIIMALLLGFALYILDVLPGF